MEPRITQCPRCGTSFRVTDAHLAVAAGAVRCGSCLHIFHAPDYWLEEELATPAEEDRNTQTDPAPLAADDDLLIDDDIVIDDDLLIDDHSPLFGDEEEQEAEATPPWQQPPVEATPIAVANFLETSWEPELKDAFGDGALLGEAGDESWAEELLDEDPLGPLESAPAPETRFTPFDEILPQAPAAEEEGADEPQISPEFLALGSAPEPEPAPAAEVQNEPGAGEESAPAAEAEPEPEPAFGGAGPRLLDRSGVLLGGFEPEPLQLRRRVREPRWPRLLWAAGLVVALGLLAFQYLHFNFDRLARGESRAWLAQLCAVAGCELPAQHDLTAIRTSSLIVRSHPARRNALAVDAILTNTALFSQPYPRLLLQFTDLDGEPVAGGIFTPEEYLGGELTGTRLMPSQQPIHIGLEVVDPGPRAVNYQLLVTGG